MKKLRAILCMLILVLSCSVAFVACDSNPDKKFGEKDPVTGIRFQLRYDFEYTVVGYDGKNSIVTIPVHYKGLPVTEISDGVYSSIDGGGYTGIAKNKKITYLKFEDGSLVKRIGTYSFFDCTNLSNVEIPPSVVDIGQNAFLNTGIWKSTPEDNIVYADNWAIGFKGDAPNFTSASINAGTQGISSCAFYNYANLTEVTIPSSVEYVGSLAFHQTGLMNNTPNNSVIYADKWAVGYVMPNVHSAEYQNNGLHDFVLRSDTVGIADGSFKYGYQILSIYVPSTVKSIGKGAFILCQALESITLSEGLVSIGEAAFKYCKSLTSIIIPLSVTQIDNYAFASDNLTIHAKALEKPKGWSINWNAERPVIWGA